MLQLHLSCQQLYCILRCDLNYRFYGRFHDLTKLAFESSNSNLKQASGRLLGNRASRHIVQTNISLCTLRDHVFFHRVFGNECTSFTIIAYEWSAPTECKGKICNYAKILEIYNLYFIDIFDSQIVWCYPSNKLNLIAPKDRKRWKLMPELCFWWNKLIYFCVIWCFKKNSITFNFKMHWRIYCCFCEIIISYLHRMMSDISINIG